MTLRHRLALQHHPDPLPGGIVAEAGWMDQAARTGQASAHVWQMPDCLVVPARYRALPAWATALAAQPAHAWQVRHSGGGVVPQGAGVWNLSLVWPDPPWDVQHSTALYRWLCGGLHRALADLGVHATAQGVNGSFCDGRFNLAVRGRKLVGTAQAWRQVGGRPVLLLHAVILVQADPLDLTRRANALEAALGTGVVYDGSAVTSLHLALRRPPPPPALTGALSRHLGQLPLPGDVLPGPVLSTELTHGFA